MRRSVDARKLVYEAREQGYAVGAINHHNEETAEAILLGAKDADAPVFVQIGRAIIPHMGIRRAFDIVRRSEEETGKSCVIHLDHGGYDEVVEALKLGVDSVMYDGAHLPFEENIATTRRVVEAAHFLGVPVEAELGKIPEVEDLDSVNWEDYYTDVDEAVRFVEETGIDYLAISVGIFHGISATTEPRLDMERIETLAKETGVPLVLHGVSGLPDETVREAVARGVAKLNIDTELRLKFREGIEAVWSEGDRHLEAAMSEGRDRMRAEVTRKLKLFGSAGRAG
ncbi:cbbA: ketose-bisphosphate aldolase [Rubrobacter radiotolerans]|uniref:CbbA: ketose-bisphosphate aldolase n=1 Tax=Rubrobacter radiotolerans TaxID=42256 RepID=A0A023X6U8_RUBRA|nr:class II fructose-bisphosphate aldolase [Rubrobacter radiotolerans]AHY47740.1 cbbA: ketose-bisphosphate aldolase [Rubrobacter radiotolerans]MDX5895216.1 class II fructose-bisphosphate aldolase [Rubrobacter radiotolerans]SMC07665.1 fructose-bisphosphate aldolase, class II [Rubrobacter radiotolerans DSM 5868]